MVGGGLCALMRYGFVDDISSKLDSVNGDIIKCIKIVKNDLKHTSKFFFDYKNEFFEPINNYFCQFNVVISCNNMQCPILKFRCLKCDNIITQRILKQYNDAVCKTCLQFKINKDDLIII